MMPFRKLIPPFTLTAQFVKIGNTKSSYETIVCGILQGSMLGPFLFLLYINDLPNCAKKLSFGTFADDTFVLHM